MKSTAFNQDYRLGKIDGENHYLRKPSWDCGWYWAVGYMGNKNCHYHMDGFAREHNMHLRDALMETFGESLTIGPRGLWTFTELMYTAYSLKEAAEVLGRGGSHTAKNPCADTIRNISEAERINSKVLPAIFDEMWKVLTDKEYAEKEPPKTTVKYAKRIYECVECGHQTEIGTNHYGECYPRCDKKCFKQTAHKFISDIKSK